MDLKRFEDYRQEVILAYKKKKKEGLLPTKLQDHTTASLKKECLAVFHDRYSDKDSKIFKEFLNNGTNARDYLKIIEESKPDIFKPLNIFLNKNADSGTHKRYIELLAWLIDFEPRPHRYADIYELVKSDENISTTNKEQEGENQEELIYEGLREPEIVSPSGEKKIIKEELQKLRNGSDNGENIDIPENTETVKDELEETIKPDSGSGKTFGIPIKFNKTIVAFFAVFVILIGSYIIYKMRTPQCMYWDKDHYQPIGCDEQVNGATIVALDTFRLTHLKKITNKALINRNGIGKIHYSKVSGKVEFYTAGGENPEDSLRRLLPMTEHMYEEHILNKPSQ